MYYFINNALNSQNSGIEHAQLQRARVFKQYKLPYKLLYMAWNPQMQRWLARFNLTRDDVLTLFDYYQHSNGAPTTIVEPKDIFLADVDLTYVPNPSDKNSVLAMQGKTLMGRIHWYGGFDDDVKRVSSVERFDIYGNLYRVDEYDVRGFLSRSQYYTPDNKIYAFTWFDLDGKPVITQTFTQNAEGKTVSGVWEVKARDGRKHYCGNFRDVVALFLNALNNYHWSIDEPNYFVGDRLEGYEDVLMDLEKPAIKIAHLHNSHGSDVHDEMKSLLNNYYEFDLYNSDRYDFYIAATHKQTDDVRERFGLDQRVVTIPVGLTTPVKQIPLSERKPHSVLVTARRAEEKRIDKIIEIVAKTHETVPDVSLTVYGYRDSRNHDAAKKKIDAMIEKYGAQDYVTINNYNADLDAERDNHQVYIVFSTMEGFNIALMEAQNHGEIAIANDVNYGPNELTVDGKNGYVVGYDDVDAGAKALTKIFTDADLAQQLSDGAYKLSERYSAEEIHAAWMDLTSQAMDFWHQTVRRDFPEKGLEEVPDLDAALLEQKAKRDEFITQARQADRDKIRAEYEAEFGAVSRDSLKEAK